jgi:hypothetical protein
MNRHRKLSIFLALFMAMTFALPGYSWAGGYRHGGYYGYGHGYRGYYSGMVVNQDHNTYSIVTS